MEGGIYIEAKDWGF